MRVIAIKVSEEVYEQIKKRAEEKGMTVSQYIKKLVIDTLTGSSWQELELIKTKIEELEKRVSELEKRCITTSNTRTGSCITISNTHSNTQTGSGAQ